MKLYNYQGIDQHGHLQQGSYYTQSKHTCRQWLLHNKIFPTKITTCHQMITAKHLVTFYQQLATLINANIPLLASLKIIYTESPANNLRNLINALQQDIENGYALSTAMQKHPRIFSKFLWNLVSAGEKAGCLDKILQYLAQYTQQAQRQKALILQALLYPITVLTIAFLVTSILLIYIIPQFIAIFASFNSGLPPYTQLIVKLATYLKKYGLALICSIGILTSVGIFALRHSITAQQKVYNLLLRLPYLNTFLKKTIICHFARTLSITFKAGIPLLEALVITANVIPYHMLQQKIMQIKAKIANGTTLTLAMQAQNFFPTMVLQFITIGEESGTLDAMLEQITQSYEHELNQILTTFHKLLEPTLMVIIGLIVGSLVIAMYLPIFQLGMQI